MRVGGRERGERWGMDGEGRRVDGIGREEEGRRKVGREERKE